MENEKIIKMNFTAEGTVCESCEKTIEKQAKKVDGVTYVQYNYQNETGSVKFDKTKTDIDVILYKIEEKGYTCYILDETAPGSSKNSNSMKTTLGWVFGIIGVLIIGYFLFSFVETINLPQLSQGMGYGLLFTVGLLTGFHCVSMCGGFVVSYTAKNAQDGKKSHLSHLMYGSGKLISYTIIGAAFGLLGSIIAFTPQIRGVAGLLAGLFLVLFGLKMLNIIPALRKIQFRTPKFISKFVGKQSSKNKSPLIIGLLNGLMIACGPLQAIYVMAAGTGSLVEGAKILFIFGLGTLPVMLGFGYFASVVSSKMTHSILKASGAIVIVLGLLMINNGLTLTGTGYDFNSIIQTVSAENNGGMAKESAEEQIPTLNNGFQEIRMDVTRYGWEPDEFILQKDMPVKWIINGKEITGCNNAIQVPKYNLEFDIKQGEQVIEFTPAEVGVVRWSCWMGMIPGTFIVKDDLNAENTKEIEEQLNSNKVKSVGTCGGSCGSTTCGSATSGGCGCGGK